MAKKQQELPPVQEEVCMRQMQQSPSILMVLNRRGTLLYYANPAAESAFEKSSTEKEDRGGVKFIPRREREDLFHHETPPETLVEYNRHFYELHFLRHSARVIVEGRDVTQYCLDLRHDRLTKLVNKWYFHEHLAAALARVKRVNASPKKDDKPRKEESREKLAVLFGDLDDFGKINDQVDYEEGDALLKEVAARLVRVSREGDVVARRSGDEFLVLANSIKGENDALLYANRIYQEFAKEAFKTGSKSYNVRISIGIAIGDGERNANDLIKEATDAMHRAKRFGHPCFNTAEE